jgi:hypothetical protein
MEGLGASVLSRAKACTVILKRADVPNLRWFFSVDAGHGAKVVRLKAERKGSATQLAKMDLHLTCSCPAWQWQGPEHYAKSEGYLDGNPRGTALAPEVVDTQKQNRVCKHVAAVLSMVQAWDIPRKG